jgi:integrase
MGSVEPYETDHGRRYRVRYRDPDRKSRQRAGFATKRRAEEYLASVTVSATRGDYVDPRDARVTISELGLEWLAAQSHLKPSTLITQETAWRVHVEPIWGHRRVGEIRHSEVATWVASFSRGERPKSATVTIRAFGVLASILDVAVRDRRTSANPARGVKLPRKTPKRRSYLTAHQVELLAASAGDKATLILVLAYTGLRWGEAIALRVSSVDALRRRLLVEENAVTIGATIHVGTPKTHERRSVPFPRFLSELIARECEGKPRHGLLFGNGVDYLAKPHTDHGWFRHSITGARALDPDFPDITPHGLRHTAASLAISAGATPKAVQRMLGHASAAMTLDVYADLFEDDLDAVSDRLEETHSRAVVGFLWGLRP